MNRAILNAKLPIWTRNATANLQAVKRRGKDIATIEGILVGNAALLLGPGPSLDLIAPYLGHSTSGRVALVVCNSALNPTVARGVVPDIVVAYDASEEVGAQIEEYVAYAPKDLVQTTRLICPVCIHPRVVEAWTGEIIWFRYFEETTPETATFFRTLKEMYPAVGQVGNLSCVASVMLGLADHMGANPLFSCGFDLPLRAEDGYGAVRYKLAVDAEGNQLPPTPITAPLKTMEENVILSHRNYVAGYLGTLRQIRARYINLSPLASFRDAVPTAPPATIAANWSKVDGAR
jgi:hypothetical protein